MRLLAVTHTKPLALPTFSKHDPYAAICIRTIVEYEHLYSLFPSLPSFLQLFTGMQYAMPIGIFQICNDLVNLLSTLQRFSQFCLNFAYVV